MIHDKLRYHAATMDNGYMVNYFEKIKQTVTVLPYVVTFSIF